MSATLSVNTGSSQGNCNQSNNGRYRHLHQLLNPGPELDLQCANTQARTEVEHYITKQFQASYGATIKDFLPLLLSLRCNSALNAVTGICPANSHHLFVEQYLDNSIEDEINRFSSLHVQRSAIAEIGNLAATQRGSSQLLFVLLAAILHQSNLEWLVFTATPQVQKIIGKLGLQLHPIKEASPLSIRQSSVPDWGSYYDTRPMVVAGRLDEAIDIINNRQVLRGMLSLYKNRIDALASVILNQNSNDNHVQYCFAA